MVSPAYGRCSEKQPVDRRLGGNSRAAKGDTIMARFKAGKAYLRRALRSREASWRVEDLWSPASPLGETPDMDSVSPLIALLPEGGLVMWRAVLGLGRVIPALVDRGVPEKARECMRRLMWQVNEDSGNLGWGAPEAMGEVLARSPLLAGEYGRILFSYVRETGATDNYIDHAPLRRGVYWAVGRLGSSFEPLQGAALLLALRGLGDADDICRAYSAWSLGRLAPSLAPADREKAAETLGRLTVRETPCDLLEGETLRQGTEASFAAEALALLQ